MDNDSIVDIVSGSNCCASTSMVFFRGRKGGGFDPYRHISLDWTSTGWNASGKTESRPFVVDWDDDGLNDLVLVQKCHRTTKPPASADGQPELEYQYQIFWKKGVVDDQAFSSVPLGNATGGLGWTGDWEHRLDVKPALLQELDILTYFPFPGMPERTYKELNFCFCDHDGDECLDILVSSRMWSTELSQPQENRPRHWEYANHQSGIFLLAGRRVDGKLHFAEPQLLHQAPPYVGFGGLAAVELDGDHELELIVATIAPVNEPPARAKSFKFGLRVY